MHSPAINDHAFAVLYREAHDSVFRVCQSILRDLHDTDEVVSRAFLQFYRYVEKGLFRGDCSAKTMVCLIGKRLALNRYHQRKMRLNDMSLDDETGAAYALPDPIVRDSRSQIEEAEEVALLEAGIAALPAQDRKMLNLRRGGAHYDQIAAEFGIPVGTVKSRLCRLRRRLSVLVTNMAGGEELGYNAEETPSERRTRMKALYANRLAAFEANIERLVA